ncbi:DUF6777 domain-containing protein [Streptomyces sp. NPDC090135]|uniref:DUF6777 domain-containing protein n=1 Tax=Streptomyces sp. NPDC090135 TaxID=3365957 RepID=UPI0037FCD89C
MRSPLRRTRRTPTAPRDGATVFRGGGAAPRGGATVPRDTTTPARDAATAPRDAATAPRDGARLAGTALVSVLLLAGCSSGGTGAGGAGLPVAAPAQDVLLQPAAAAGPDPFTASTVRNTLRPSAPPPAIGERQTREVTGSTPGLYGGTRAVGSCDVERQASLLTGDAKKARAFADAAGVPEAGVADWLRGLTPVALRVDARVTGHGYRGGRAAAHQAVLETGTAVLVDQYGAPRVRCAGGNPLRAPGPDRGGVYAGVPWDAFDPDHVVVVRPTGAVVTGLVIVNATDRTWIERRTGSDGEEDRKPAVEPSCDPDACLLEGSGTPDPDASGPATPSSPDRSTSPEHVPPPQDPQDPPVPDGPTDPAPEIPDPYAEPDPSTEPLPDPFEEPPAPPDGELPPEEMLPPEVVPDQPETYEAFEG